MAIKKRYNSIGQVGLLLSFGYGKGWSTTENDKEIKMIMLMDKSLIDYVLECRKHNSKPSRSKMKIIWEQNFPSYKMPCLDAIPRLNVMWIDSKQPIQVKSLKGAEYIYSPCDDPAWIIP